MAEKFKDVTINGRQFRIGKFSARTGSFVLIKVSSSLAPMFAKLDFSKLKDAKSPKDVDLGAIDIPGMIAELGNISESDFDYLQGKCLCICTASMPAGFIPVLNDNGSFGVMDLEEDVVTVMALMVHALIFNLSGFFQGSGLAGIMGGLLTTNPQG